MTEDHKGLMSLAQSDVLHMRLTGLILTALVHKNMLTAGEARALVADVMTYAPDDSPLRPALLQLHADL